MTISGEFITVQPIVKPEDREPPHCGICLENFDTSSSDPIVSHSHQEGKLTCLFHEACLKLWVKTKNECPCDRIRITSINGVQVLEPESETNDPLNRPILDIVDALLPDIEAARIRQERRQFLFEMGVLIVGGCLTIATLAGMAYVLRRNR